MGEFLSELQHQGKESMIYETLNLPTNRFIDLPEVTRLTSLKKTKIYELIKKGEIRSIKLGSKTVFSELGIQGWMAARMAESHKTVGAYQ